MRLGERLFVGMQRVLPQHTLSRGIHRLARSRWGPLRRALIGAFVRGFRPQMDDAIEPDPQRYPSFNEFFTRALSPGARPIDPDPRAVIAPVDGTVSQIGYLDELRILQAKGRTYALDALLGGAAEWTRALAGGAFATLYLAPYNYHRIHMPLAGTLRAAWYVPGRLFSVNAVTAAAVTGLFARNERVVCAFEELAPSESPFALVLVGALFVGSIATVWHGDVAPARPRRALALAVPAAARLERGAEMGRFNMGSTVILLFPPGRVRWAAQISAGSTIRVGQAIGQLSASA